MLVKFNLLFLGVIKKESVFTVTNQSRGDLLQINLLGINL